MADIDTPEQYADFYAPEVKILINGQKISAEGIDITEVKVERILDGADTFTFVIPKALNDKLEVNHPNMFQFGDKVEIFMGYKDKLFSLITGVITSLSWSFDEENYLDLTVEGYDYLFLMMKNERYHSWNNKTDAQVIKEIVKKYPFKKLNIENTSVEYFHIRQEGESDFNFLKRLAKRNGYEYLAEGETFIFKLPGVEKKEKFVLKLGKDLLEFAPRMDIVQQVSEVRVVGWNPESKKEIIEYATQEDVKDVDRDGKTGAQTIQSICKEEVITEIRASVQDNEEAKLLAKSIFFDIAYSMVQAQCKAIGIPELRPGQTIQIKGVGDLFSRKYYVDKVTHEIGKDGYDTNFTVKGNTYNESY